MGLSAWPTVTDDSGTKQDGTVFNKALTDAIKASIEASIFSVTNPSVSAASIIDEVIAARGSLASLDARLDVTLNEDGTPKANASYVAASTYQVGLGHRNLCINGDFSDWTLGAALAPDNWTLAGAAGTIAQTGPAMGDTFSFGAGRYTAKITRAGTDVTLTQDIIAAADWADYAEVASRKCAVAAKVKASAGSAGRVRLDDGFTAAVGSSYHSGSGSVQHLTEVLTISSSATKVSVILEVKNSNVAVYFGGVAVVFADLAPTDWQPKSREQNATSTRAGLIGVGAQTISGGKSATVGTGTAIGYMPLILHNSSTFVGNVGGGADDLKTYTLPANTLTTNGDAIRITAWFTTPDNGNTKTIELLFGSTVLVSLASTNAVLQTGAVITAVVSRTGAATQTAVGDFSSDGTTTFGDRTRVTAPTETLANAIVIKGRGTSAASVTDEIIMKGLLIEYLPAVP